MNEQRLTLGGVIVLIALALVMIFIPLLAGQQSDLEARSYQTSCYTEQGGAKIVAASGCTIEMQSGSLLDVQAGATAEVSGGFVLPLIASVSSGTATPAWSVNQTGAGQGFRVLDGGTPAIENFDGGGVSVYAPTAVATGQPGLVVNSAGVSNIFEVRDAATPVVQVANGGAATFASTLGATGAINGSADIDVGTFLNLSAATPISVTAGATITPTGTYQPLTSGAAVTCSTANCIENGGETGDVVILRNANASDTITIDGTGGNVECKADIVMGAGDIVGLIWNGTDWNCLYVRDNS